MKNFSLNDLVLREDRKGIFTVVGIREFELELEDETSCDWVCISKVSHYVEDNHTDLEDWYFLQNKMENEGFHYCFRHYSKWKEIKDQRFHELRLEYLNSANRLKTYIQDMIENLENK